MEDKTIKINNLEVKCEALIEFSSLANVLLELVKRQKELEKKLNEHDIKINNIKKIISSGIGGGADWQEKENEISNILKDDYQFNINMNDNDNNNNSHISNDLNNESKKDNSNYENDENNNNYENNESNENNNNYENNESNENNENNDSNENNENKDNDMNISKNEKDIDTDIININKDGGVQKETEKKNKNYSQSNKANKNGKKSSNPSKENEIKLSTITPIDKKDEDDIKMVAGDNSNNSDLVSRLFKKVVILEKKVNELITKSGEHTVLIKNIQNNRQAINGNTKNIKNLNEMIKKLKNEIDKMKSKFEDFNIFDMFKDSGDGNIDMAKGMVMALESKMKKRMDLFDEKYKLISNENVKNKNDIQNISGIVDNSKLLIDKNKTKIEEIINNIKDKDIQNNEEKENGNTEIIQKINNIIKNIENMEKNNDKKINELEERIKTDLKNANTSNKKVEKPKKRELDDSYIREMNEKLIELEKNVKHIFKKFNVDEINSNLAILQKEVLKKGNQGAIDEITDRIYILDELMKEINGKCDSFVLLDQKTREETSLLSKKIESMSNQIHRISLNMSSGPKEEKSIIDMTKFIDINTFDDNKKEINRKFDKIRISFEDILRNIEEILNKLSHTPTDKDFSQFQGVIKNMLDELKLSCNRKYSDKYETLKNIKFLETQIKSINEQYVKKAEGQDNWLLAKKPLSKYLCASCEGVIRGELDNRCDYIPWNKYPNREEKYTRMGHGFSHMLQLVNDDIRKNVDNKEKSKNKDKNNEKEYNSDEDKKKNILEKSSLNNTSTNVKLPKVKQRTINNNNLIYLDEGVLEKNGQSPYDNIDKNKSVLDSNNNGPHIIKISKLKKITNKRSFQESSLNDENSNRGTNLHIKTLPSELPSFTLKKEDIE